MTDYNDGEWHRYAGDGIPPGVHEKSWVEYGLVNGSGGYEQCKDIEWHRVCRFRVTKVHGEPFEIWAAIRPNGRLCKTAYKRDDLLWDKPVGSRIVLLREAIE